MRPLKLAVAVVVALAGAGGCGGGGYGNPSSPSPSSSSAAAITIAIVGNRGAQSFSPNPAVAAGQMVVFRNTDSVVHRVRLNDLSVDTGDIAPGGTSQAVRIPEAGTNCHCFLHQTMVGAVSGATTAPPPCTGLYC